MPYLIISQGTAKTKFANLGQCFPESGIIRTSKLTVTCAAGAGTMYVFMGTSGVSRNGTTRERTMIPLTKGQSFTFTGVPLANGGYHSISFGTGYSYIYSSATPQRATFAYYSE